MTLSEMQPEEPKAGQQPMSVDEIAKLSPQVPEWKAKDGSLERDFKFGTFDDAIDFINCIADIANEMNHHPTIHNTYNKVKIELSTHKVGGLTINDFILAARIDEGV
jgi:4a-hydroxytetrahydrobiopterin dehydratase